MLVGVVAAGVVAILTLAVTLARSEQQASREYLDAVYAVATGEGDLAGRYRDLVDRLPELQRPAVISELELLGAEARVLADEASRAEPAGGEGRLRADSFLRIAVTSWRNGLTGFLEAVLTLSEDPLSATGRSQMEAALSDLRVGDAAYAEFRSAMIIDAGDSPLVEQFPAVRFVPADRADDFTAEVISRRLMLAPGLGVRKNLAVADLRLDPGPAGERNGIPVIPAGETLAVQATISNRGTVPLEAVIVTLSLISNEGDTHQESRVIERIEPGQLTVVTFTEVPAVGGRLYELTVALGVQDDDPSDDRTSFQFIRDGDE